MAYFPPPGYFPPGYGMGYPGPGGGGVPSYPGPPWIQNDPRFQYNPTFDGLFSHGLTTSPYLNSQLEDVNMIQHQIYSSSGVGYMPYGMPMMPPMFPPGYFPPPKKRPDQGGQENKGH